MKAPYFHLAFRPNITLVSTLRRFIGELSGLGLARMRAECEMKLGFELMQDRVCMMATMGHHGGLTQ